MALPRRWLYGLTGALLALGAPSGLLALRAVETIGASLRPSWIVSEIAGDPWLYAYLMISTALVFALFGYLVGRQADRLSELSISDPLTGLPNARAFAQRLAEECARATRYETPLSLLLIDVDDLKQLNDSSGHFAGDQALRLVAAAVRGGSRVSDSLSRWGGDEFAVIAPNTDAPAAEQMAERIRALAVHAPTPAAAITVSVGVATWESDADPCLPEALRKRADDALYQAKRDGRNRVRAAPPRHGPGFRASIESG